MNTAKKRFTNRLIHEQSPYLLQHARNPVDWYPWGQEAFEKAKKEYKPVFLSVGYATCHWCHVMEKESFEDPEVARLMNEAFVSIKVDREERPDIDSVYMKVCQLLMGSGGWPLNIIMTPDKKPFFASTYIPRENRFGRLGMLELIPRLNDLWKNRSEELEDSADKIIAVLKESAEGKQPVTLDADMLEAAYKQLEQQFNPESGGFGLSPKFPVPHNLFFLLRYWKRTEKEKALEMVEKTLQSMRQGGIFDHLGHGFHRYSTDAKWLVPHFEKMLYDQALLAMAYIEAYQATRNDEYRRTAEEIFSYILRDMTSPEGAFYSAEDADSEGIEGKFYLWTYDEILNTLGKTEGELAVQVFNIKKEGNFVEEASGKKTGVNLLHLKKTLAETASALNLSPEVLSQKLEKIRKNLFSAREKRVRPLKDDKILTDWNGLMIAALAKGAQAFDEPGYAKAAIMAADFILKNMRSPDGRLLHRYRKGEASIPAFLDDHAFLVWGLIELYQASFDARFLQAALELNDIMLAHFWDKQNGAFYFSADDGERLLIRQKEVYDGAIPSGNSAAMLNLLRLSRMTSNPGLEHKAAQIGHHFSPDVSRSPSAFSLMMTAVDLGIGPSNEVVLAGSSAAEDAQAMLQALRSEFLPNTVVLFIPSDRDAPDILRLVPFASKMKTIKNKATVYVCQNFTCQQPTTDIDKMLHSLGVKKPKNRQKS